MLLEINNAQVYARALRNYRGGGKKKESGNGSRWIKERRKEGKMQGKSYTGLAFYLAAMNTYDEMWLVGK